MFATVQQSSIDTHPTFAIVMLVGSLGALAPEVVTLYKLRHSHLRFSLWYFVISFLYALFGGLIAVLLQASTLYSAFYDGVTLPFIIGAMTKTRYPKPKGIVRASSSEKPKTAEPKRTLWELLREHSNALLE